MRSDRWIEQAAAAAIFPEQVATTLTRLQQAWPSEAPSLRDVVENFPLGEGTLLHLFSVSSICAARVINDPASLLWLNRPEVCHSHRGQGRMLADLAGLTTAPIAENNFQALRIWKGREMTRLALREVAEVASVDKIAAELSQLAEICLAKVLEHWDSELRKRLGSPAGQFAILALGKLGGRELNHSSDIDLIFLYSEEGQLTANLSYHEWFNRLGAKIVETFSSKSPAGSLFRIDLRLRPEGSAGPLARSLESMENYYAGFGEAWEQLALVRARGVAGSEELSYEFLRQHQPFIFPKSPTPDLLEEVTALKRRIERDVVGHENLDRNVKLGAGGIREIEFIAQSLQMLHGARNAFLQETSTLKTLRALGDLDLLPPKDCAALTAAYRFLRRVEHRLQIEAEQQTHTIPQDEVKIARLAQSLGFPAAENFSAELQQRMFAVRKIFQRTMRSSSPNESSETDLSFFRDEIRSTRTLAELAQGSASFHIAPRTRQVFRKLRPLLLEQLSAAADPDGTLNQFIRFVDAYGMRSLLFEMLVVNPRLLELIVRVFDSSRHASDLLIRRPQLLEEITRGRALEHPLSVADHIKRLESLKVTSSELDPVRSYRQNRWLRILLRDLLGLSDSQTIAAEHSALAEACMLFVCQLLGENQLTLVAMGKFGGQEMTYGADLDVLFVGEEAKGAQTLVVTMAQRSAEGNIATLDARLRPEGETGPLVSSLEAYESYYQNRAQLWEIQALTRARGIFGPKQEQFTHMAKRVWLEAGQSPDLFPEIKSMVARIRRDRGTGSAALDFKTGEGGMVEAEFAVQALQMRSGIWNPNWTAALTELNKQGIIPDRETKKLRLAYDFLRRCEAALRRRDNKAISSLPADENAQRELSHWLGCQGPTEFGERYRVSREDIHAFFSGYLDHSYAFSSGDN